MKAENSEGLGTRSPILTVIAAGLPGAPAAPTIEDVTSTSIDVAWMKPSDMMGSAPTGYVLYMFAGVAPNTVANPNPVQFEVQTITVDADSQESEVQDVTLGDVTGGTFSLRFRGQSTSELAYNAGRNALRDALSELSNVGTVDVTRSGGGNTFTWSITFNALDGDVPALFVDTAMLEGGANLKATVDEITKGSGTLDGDFTVSFLGHETAPLSITASDTDVKGALENPDTIGSVAVSKTSFTESGRSGLRWAVTFLTEMGDVALMQATSGRLVGVNYLSTRGRRFEQRQSYCHRDSAGHGCHNCTRWQPGSQHETLPCL